MKRASITSAFFLIGLLGCASTYDENTHKSFVSLQDKTTVFMDRCSSNGAFGMEAASAINDLRGQASEIHAHELSRPKNDKTTSQVESLSKIFDEVHDRFINNKLEGDLCIARESTEIPELSTGCLTSGYCKGKFRVLKEAFDIAISTEVLKKK